MRSSIRELVSLIEEITEELKTLNDNLEKDDSLSSQETNYVRSTYFTSPAD